MNDCVMTCGSVEMTVVRLPWLMTSQRRVEEGDAHL